MHSQSGPGVSKKRNFEHGKPYHPLPPPFSTFFFSLFFFSVSSSFFHYLLLITSYPFLPTFLICSFFSPFSFANPLPPPLPPPHLTITVTLIHKHINMREVTQFWNKLVHVLICQMMILLLFDYS